MPPARRATGQANPDIAERVKRGVLSDSIGLLHECIICQNEERNANLSAPHGSSETARKRSVLSIKLIIADDLAVRY